MTEVTVPGDAESFAQLLNCAYTGELTVSLKTIASILNMATFMSFDQAIDLCSQYLLQIDVKDSDISTDTCLEIWSIANNHVRLSDVAQSYRKHLTQNFKKCGESEVFLENADVDFLLESLCDEEIETDTCTEKQVCGQKCVQNYDK